MFRELELMYSQEEERYLHSSSSLFWQIWNSFRLDRHTANRQQIDQFTEQTVHRPASSQTSQFTDQPVHRTASSQNSQFTDQPVHRTASSQNSQFTDQPVHRPTSSYTNQFTDQPVHRPTSSQTIRSQELSCQLFCSTKSDRTTRFSTLKTLVHKSFMSGHPDPGRFSNIVSISRRYWKLFRIPFMHESGLYFPDV